MTDIDRHKIYVDADLVGRNTMITLDGNILNDVVAFDFHVDAESLTVATLTMCADVTLDGKLLSEYFKVKLPEKQTFWERLKARVKK